jgi:V/A-type H+-transporting ATPase subunit D
MTQQTIKVRPTKIELIRLRRRLSLATRIQKIIKDRLSILMLEFLQIARETVEARQKMLDEFSMAYRSLSVASGLHGYLALEKEFQASEKELELISGSRNVAGARVVSFELKEDKTPVKSYSLVDTSAYVDQTQQLFESCLRSMVALAELQSSLELLGKEINRTKRILNALDYLIIPGLKETIKFLYMKFEERDREEKSRLKRVKALLEQRGG